MAKAKAENLEPPKLRRTSDGEVDVNSLADLLEWFLMGDEPAKEEPFFPWITAEVNLGV